jgi:hypothetical protein
VLGPDKDLEGSGRRLESASDREEVRCSSLLLHLWGKRAGDWHSRAGGRSMWPNAILQHCPQESLAQGHVSTKGFFCFRDNEHSRKTAELRGGELGTPVLSAGFLKKGK